MMTTLIASEWVDEKWWNASRFQCDKPPHKPNRKYLWVVVHQLLFMVLCPGESREYMSVNDGGKDENDLIDMCLYQERQD